MKKNYDNRININMINVLVKFFKLSYTKTFFLKMFLRTHFFSQIFLVLKKYGGKKFCLCKF